MSKFINYISLLLFIALFIFTPFSFMARVVVLYSLFAVWLLSSALIDPSFLKRTIPFWVYLFAFFVLAYGKSVANPDVPIVHFIHTSFFSYVWLIFFIFYQNKAHRIKKIVPFVLIMIIVSCIFTIRGNLLFPGASRALASVSLSTQNLRLTATSYFVGGYGFVYSLCFLLVPVIHLIRNKRSVVLASIALLSIYGSLITASFFLAIILGVFLTILSISDSRKSLKTLLLLLLFSIVLLFFKDSLLQMLIDVGERINSPMLSLRAEEMLNGSYQDEYDLNGDYSRIERIQNALLNFMDSPLTGELGGLSNIKRPSGHSELLGYFESYGVLGFLFVLFFIYSFKTIHISFLERQERFLFILTYVCFLVFISINTFEVANAVGLAVFFIVPSVLRFIECTVTPINR